jgi:DUF1680 family protein
MKVREALPNSIFLPLICAKVWAGDSTVAILKPMIRIPIQSLLFKSLALFCFGPAAHQAAAAPADSAAELERLSLGSRQIRTFDYKGVTLDAGPLRRQFDEIRDYYLHIPNDDLLKGFRARSGLLAPGADLGGWYTRDFFHIFGQILSGLSRMYAATGDPACKEKLDALIDGWSQTIGADGYFFYTNKPNAPHYTYEKMAGGLVDAYLYGKNREALKYLSRITDWAVKNLDRSRPFSYNSPQGDTEWYTLTENLYRAYLITGEKKYRDFGAVWEYTRYWDLYASKADIFSPFDDAAPFQAYHAYSHLNTLAGAGAAYLVTGQPRYLATLRNGYEFFVNSETFATGGFGPNERLMPVGNNIATLERLGFHFETQCGSWAVFKLGKYLLTLTGDAGYGDWVERVLVNGIGASIPMSPDGSVFYYSDYNIHGGSKSNHNPWSCCAGTRPMAAADFHDLIYFHDDANLYVNLFTSASVTWPRSAGSIRLRQQTRFPEADRTEFQVWLDHPAAFGLKLRIPGWLAGRMQAVINGKPVQLDIDRKHWAVISRTWQNGDRLALTLPSNFWLSRLPGSGSSPAAVMRGPVTMAFRSASGNPSSEFNFQDLDSNFEQRPSQPLNYHLKGDGAVLARPFYDFKEGESYFMYLLPDLDLWSRPMHITATPKILNTPWFSFTNTAGSVIDFPFNGRSIRWTGFRFEDGGKAEVSIDGAVVGIIDQYGPAHMPATPPTGKSLPFEWEYNSLKPGNHNLRIRTLDEKNADSKGRRITVARIDAHS